MSGHTPKPWHIEEQWHGIAIKAGKRTVARTSPWSNQEEWANARLMAAAPELLDALEAFNDWFDAAVGNPGAPIVEMARTAIASARGAEDR